MKYVKATEEKPHQQNSAVESCDSGAEKEKTERSSIKADVQRWSLH